jgi:hypothetical protein
MCAVTDPQPETDAGPLWMVVGRAAGIALLASTVGIALLAVALGRTIDKWLVILALVPMIAGLVLLRPKWMQWLVETVADRLPFVKFTKPAP